MIGSFASQIMKVFTGFPPGCNPLLVKYFVCGLFNTALGYAIFPTFYFLFNPMGVHYLFILPLSQAVVVTVAFWTSKTFVFQTSGNTLCEYMKYVSFHIIYFIFNLIALPLLLLLDFLTPVSAQTFLATIIIFTSFFWHKKITFSRREGRLSLDEAAQRVTGPHTHK